MILRKQEQLLIDRGLPIQITAQVIKTDNDNFLNNLVINAFNQGGLNKSYLPQNSPFEIHPYKNLIQLGQFDKYIIGTFPPVSYVYDLLSDIDIIKQPKIGNNRKIPKPGFPFFHGNKNLMWDYLLTENEKTNLPLLRQNVVNYLIGILNNAAVNYSDVIDSVQRQLDNNNYKGSDNLLYNISINLDLMEHILSNTHARYLLFNTASVYGVSGLRLTANGYVDLRRDLKSFDVFVRVLQELGYEIMIRMNAGLDLALNFQWTYISDLALQQRSTKLAFEMKVINPRNNPSNFCKMFERGTERVFTVITPFSPAVAHKKNHLAGNPIVAGWQQINNNDDTRNMLFQIYQNFRNENWNDLFIMNR